MMGTQLRGETVVVVGVGVGTVVVGFNSSRIRWSSTHVPMLSNTEDADGAGGLGHDARWDHSLGAVAGRLRGGASANTHERGKRAAGQHRQRTGTRNKHGERLLERNSDATNANAKPVPD